MRVPNGRRHAAGGGRIRIMAFEPVPSFVHFERDPDAQRLILDWIEETVLKLPWHIDADFFGPGLPPRILSMDELTTAYLMDRGLEYEDRDRVWAKIVQLANGEGRQGELWRILAIHLTLEGLRNAYWTLARNVDDDYERQDIQHDLIEGFFIRLKKINLDKPNIAGRLIGTAKGNARLHYQRRHPKIPKTDTYIRFYDIDTHDPGVPGEPPGGIQAAMTDLAEEMHAAGQPLDPQDSELIWRSRIDKQTLKHAAAAMSMDIEVAYKRRQKAEKRIAEVYRIHVRRGAHRPPATPGEAAG